MQKCSHSFEGRQTSWAISCLSKWSRWCCQIPCHKVDPFWYTHSGTLVLYCLSFALVAYHLLILCTSLPFFALHGYIGRFSQVFKDHGQKCVDMELDTSGYYVRILWQPKVLQTIDPLHEQEKSVKLRKLSSNGRHVGRQGLCKIVLASAKQWFCSIVVPGLQPAKWYLMNAMGSPTYYNYKKKWCLRSLQTSGKGGLCTFSP